MTRTTNPLAALLDAQVDAQHAGVSQEDVGVLQDIGEEIAAFAERIAARFSELTTGAAGTNRSNPKGPPTANFEFDEPASFTACLITTFEEDGYGYSLDHIELVRTAAELRLAAPPIMARAA